MLSDIVLLVRFFIRSVDVYWLLLILISRFAYSCMCVVYYRNNDSFYFISFNLFDRCVFTVLHNLKMHVIYSENELY